MGDMAYILSCSVSFAFNGPSTHVMLYALWGSYNTELISISISGRFPENLEVYHLMTYWSKQAT
jgi:hypothetical protein